VFGVAFGSFLSLVICRILDRGTIPVDPWIVVRSRFRRCGSHISVRYRLVECGAIVFFAGVALHFAPPATDTNSPLMLLAAVSDLLAFVYLAAISIPLSIIDLAVRRLPNVIVLPAYGVGALLLGAASILGNDYPALIRAAIGCAGLGLVYVTLAVAVPGGMGFGDVKLAGVLGLFLGWLGWGPLAVGALLAFVLGGLFAVALIIIRKGSRKSTLPFGPWMLAGAWVGIFSGSPLAAGYLSLMTLD